MRQIGLRILAPIAALDIPNYSRASFLRFGRHFGENTALRHRCEQEAEEDTATNTQRELRKCSPPGNWGGDFFHDIGFGLASGATIHRSTIHLTANVF